MPPSAPPRPPAPAAGAPETSIVSGSVRRSCPSTGTVTGPISKVPSRVAWNRYWIVNVVDMRPLTICIDVDVPEPR